MAKCNRRNKRFFLPSSQPTAVHRRQVHILFMSIRKTKTIHNTTSQLNQKWLLFAVSKWFSYLPTDSRIIIVYIFKSIQFTMSESCQYSVLSNKKKIRNRIHGVTMHCPSFDISLCCAVEWKEQKNRKMKWSRVWSRTITMHKCAGHSNIWSDQMNKQKNTNKRTTNKNKTKKTMPIVQLPPIWDERRTRREKQKITQVSPEKETIKRRRRRKKHMKNERNETKRVFW